MPIYLIVFVFGVWGPILLYLYNASVLVMVPEKEIIWMPLNTTWKAFKSPFDAFSFVGSL